MAETDKNTPRVINKSGTLKMDDKTAATKQLRDISGKKMERRNRRDRVRADAGSKEFDEITIAVDRVSRTVAGGRRMRFKALVAVGNRKNKVGIGVAKGNDVTTAVAKASRKAKHSMLTFNMNGETICHETRTKVTGADVLMKPAAPGTGVIAGGTVRSIMGLTGVKNLISKSLGSTNKVNIAYAVMEGLRQQVPRKDWNGTKSDKAEVKTADKTAVKSEAKKAAPAKAAPAKATPAKAVAPTKAAPSKAAANAPAKAKTATKTVAKSAAKTAAKSATKVATKPATESTAKKPAAKRSTAKKETK